jgi:hypothetical protein
MRGCSDVDNSLPIAAMLFACSAMALAILVIGKRLAGASGEIETG